MHYPLSTTGDGCGKWRQQMISSHPPGAIDNLWFWYLNRQAPSSSMFPVNKRQQKNKMKEDQSTNTLEESVVS